MAVAGNKDYINNMCINIFYYSCMHMYMHTHTGVYARFLKKSYASQDEKLALSYAKTPKCINIYYNITVTYAPYTCFNLAPCLCLCAIVSLDARTL